MKKNDTGMIDAEQTVPADAEPTMAQLLALILDTRKGDQQIQREQLKQTRQKNNLQPPNISAFNPRGEKDYPMPHLAFDVLAPWPMQKGKYHPLTVEEVTLMNRVQAPSEVVIDLRDDTTVRCSIIATKNSATGKIERIAFMGARDSESNQYVTLYSKERRHEMPTMVPFLHQVLDQQGIDYSDVLTMKELHQRIALPSDHPQYLPVSIGE